VEEGQKGAGSLDGSSCDDVVESCPDSLGAESLCITFAEHYKTIGLISRVWIVIHDTSDVRIEGLGI
jgi:hypothetical protein